MGTVSVAEPQLRRWNYTDPGPLNLCCSRKVLTIKRTALCQSSSNIEASPVVFSNRAQDESDSRSEFDFIFALVQLFLHPRQVFFPFAACRSKVKSVRVGIDQYAFSLTIDHSFEQIPSLRSSFAKRQIRPTPEPMNRAATLPLYRP